jgi:hypothetical protein
MRSNSFGLIIRIEHHTPPIMEGIDITNFAKDVGTIKSIKTNKVPKINKVVAAKILLFILIKLIS